MTADQLRAHGAAEMEMASYLGRIATGPTLSKDLSRTEARAAMELVLRGQVDRAQAAVFLAALRMKRESHDELLGVLDGLSASAVRVVAEVEELVDMAEPYNGYVRHLSCAAFVPALLAACKVPCVLHGCREIGPKWGMTAHRVLAAAGVDVNVSPAQAAGQVAGAGWAYVDVTRFCEPLAALGRLRTLIVKRSCLSLLEKLIRPIAAQGRTHLWIGYTHRGYPEILAALAREAGYESMLAVRGVEGGVLTSLSGRVQAARYGMGHEALEDTDIAAPDVVEAAVGRAPELPVAHPPRQPSAPPSQELVAAWARAAAEAGHGALAGEPGPFADMMVLGAAAMLRHLGKADNLREGADRARAALANGAAKARFAALCGG